MVCTVPVLVPPLTGTRGSYRTGIAVDLISVHTAVQTVSQSTVAVGHPLTLTDEEGEEQHRAISPLKMESRPHLSGR